LNLKVINVPELRDTKAVLQLLKFIRELNPDIVHGHSSKAGVLARVASLVAPKSAVLYTPHAYYGMSREPYLKRAIYSLVETVLARVGTTINISADEAAFGQHVLKAPTSRRQIIPNPVDTFQFQPPSPERRKAAREQLGFAEHHEVVGLVARMCWQKDPVTAYLAIAEVARRHPHLRFVHVAWGKWKEYLLDLAREKGIASRIQILSYMEDPTTFFHAIDALVISSRYEAGWPFVALEALACNMPVIAATCPGLSNFGRAGLSHVYTFSPEDHVGCARATEAWLAQRGADAGPPNHRTYAIQNFALESCFGSVLELYRTEVAATVAPARARELKLSVGTQTTGPQGNGLQGCRTAPAKSKSL